MKQADPSGRGSTEATREQTRKSGIAPEKRDNHKGCKSAEGKEATEEGVFTRNYKLTRGSARF